MKTLKKTISMITIIALVLSLVSFSALAQGVDLGSVGNNAEIVITYYSDSDMNTVITKAEPGDTVYAKVGAKLPSATLRQCAFNLNVTNATLESETNANLFETVLNGVFERGTALAGANAINADKTSVNIAISKKLTETYNREGSFSDIQSATFDISSYELKISDSATDGSSVTLSAVATGNGLMIGVYDEDDAEDYISTPFTTTGGSLTVQTGGTPATPVVSTVYSATIASDKLDPDSYTEEDVKNLVTVEKVVTTDGTSATPVPVDNAIMAVDRDAKTVTVTYPTDETNQGATSVVLNYNLYTVTYQNVETSFVDNNTNLDFATYSQSLSKIEKLVVVTADRMLDSAVDKNVKLVAGTDYDSVAQNTANANSGKVTVTFKGDKVGTETTKEIPYTFVSMSTEYSNIIATLTTSEFTEGASRSNVENAVSVKATKTSGFVVTENVDLVLGTDYTVNVNEETLTTNGSAAVTLIGDFASNTLTSGGTLDYTVTSLPITFNEYEMNFADDITRFRNDVTDQEISSKVTVTANKYKGGSFVENVTVAPAEYVLTVDRSNGKVIVDFNDDSVHSNQANLEKEINLYDDIRYMNPKAVMSTKTFDADVTDDIIKAAVSVTNDKYINDVFSENVSMDDSKYSITVDRDARTVTVGFIDTSYENIVIQGIVIGTQITAQIDVSATEVTQGNDFNAKVYVSDLAAGEIVRGGTIKLTATNGKIGTITAGSGFTILTGATGSEFERVVEFAKDTTTSANASNEIFTAVIGTTDSDVSEDAKVKVTEISLTTVIAEDVYNLTAYPSEEKTVSIKSAIVVPTTKEISASFKVNTLGDTTSAADKFKNALTLTGGEFDGNYADAVSYDPATKTISLTNFAVKAGTYTVKVELDGYTKAEVTITVSLDTVNNVMAVTGGTDGNNAIYAGDTNANNTIDADDYANVVQEFGNNIQQKYDFYTADNADKVNLNDIITLVYEFEQLSLANVSPAGLLD